jgi:Family of unknown function (DUF6325)
MPIGPVEYIVIGFPENRFTGAIVPALTELVDSGTIRIIDLVFVKKDADGSVMSFEFDALEELAEYAGLDGEAGGLLNEEDIEIAADALEPNSSAALLVWEDAWAAPLATALREAGGVLLAGERIPYEIVEAAFEELSAGA